MEPNAQHGSTVGTEFVRRTLRIVRFQPATKTILARVERRRANMTIGLSCLRRMYHGIRGPLATDYSSQFGNLFPITIATEDE